MLYEAQICNGWENLGGNELKKLKKKTDKKLDENMICNLAVK